MVVGQTADFVAPAAVCTNQLVKLQNTSASASRYEWDFCQGDLAETPSSLAVNSVGGATVEGIDVVFDGSSWYGFVASRDNNSIIRLDFGSSITSVPTTTDLGNIGGLLNKPTDIRVVEDAGSWYGFVYCANGNLITRIDFGSSLENTSTSPSPITAQVVLAGTGSGDSGLDVEKSDGMWYIFYAKNGSVGMLRLSSITTIPDVTNSILHSVPNVSLLADCVLARQTSGEWFGYSVSNGGLKSIQRFSFGSDLFSTPVITDISSTMLGSLTPYGVDIGLDNGSYTLFISSVEGGFVRVNLGNELSEPPLSGGTIANLTGPGNTLTLKLINVQTAWHAFTIPWNSGQLFRLDFPSPACNASPLFSNEESPIVSFSTAGTRSISLKSFDGLNVDEKTKEVIVSALPAPDANIAYSNFCALHSTNFSVDTDMMLATYQWDFGDLSNSISANPSHIYNSAGDYIVNLIVIATNGCENIASQTVKIYNKPDANFTMPGNLLCTNDEIIFINAVTDIYDGNLSYEWYINESAVSVTRDLAHTFNNGGIFAVKLKTSIPGCSDELTQNTSTVVEGPVVDFDYDGNCTHKSIVFTSAIEGSINSLLWHFGGLGNSDQQNPEFTFTNFGNFDVTLSALSANGCNTEKTKTVTVDERPTPDFSIESPPSGCSGSPSSFTDLTPSLINTQIESWQWNFADGGTNNNQNPNHTFQNAGNYNVELTVTSDAGCSNSIVKPVTILQSPTISFENSPACLNKPTSFTSSSNNAVQYYWEVGASLFETQNINYSFNTVGAQPVKLSVVGANACVATLTKDIVVPVPASPTFTVTNICSGFESQFASLSAGNDPVVNRLWDFAGQGTSTDANPKFTFISTGNKNVSLQVTTASGCVYQRQDVVSVIAPPLADFSFSPDFGVPPQEISFTNQSSNATSFAWNFDDGNSSTQQSPKHIFSALGDFDVELSASNSAGCETRISKVVSMVAPLPDVDLSLMTISTNPDGTLKVIVTIANNGNTMVRNLPVRLDVSGQVTLETVVTEIIAPFSMYNLVLNYSIAQTKDLQFLCAATTLEGDLHPEGNRICNQLQSDLAIITPYPNPAKDLLTLEWVAQGGEEIELTLIDARGQTVLSYTDISSTGLNQKSLDLQNVHSGVYILRILTSTGSQMHRILVSN